MADLTPLDIFFSAWALSDENSRRHAIETSVAPDFTYSDPRLPSPVTGIDALVAMVGEFAANAPGWAAWVEASETHGPFTRARIAFGEGGDAKQHGTYFTRQTGGKLDLIAGFKGTTA